ncbi:phosphatase phospho-type [Gongronella butleri]|nr:phosphatase phospho-type [Gongronella butleri]
MRADRNLAVFDFDWSLIEQDSDHWCTSHLSAAAWAKVQEQAKSVQWTDLIDQTFSELQDQGVTIEQMQQVLQKIPFTPAMLETLKALNSHDTHVVILSDANSFFIETILEAYGVRDLVHHIITNPAHLDDHTGRLRIERRRPQSAPPHQCPHPCTPNICKGQELDAYLALHGPYQKIMYVGDGTNDYCPATRLREGDRYFVRNGKGLKAYLEEHPDDLAGIKATITYWDTSITVHEAVEQEVL